MIRLFMTLTALLLPVTCTVGAPNFGLPEAETGDTHIVSLGQRLFFDRRLSVDNTLSCADCHIPEQGFTQNHLATSVGFKGQVLRRNSPSLLNVRYLDTLFHDGRETSLETQVLSPLLSMQEMANPSIGLLLQRIASLDDYKERFDLHLGGLDMATLGQAIAAYERSLVAADSHFDRWYYGDQQDAMTTDAVAGFAIFNRHGCGNCHLVNQTYATFEDGQFHNTGIGYQRAIPIQPDIPGSALPQNTLARPAQKHPAKRWADLGRYEITGDPLDRWRYRTPTLRNISLTAPYMHDGSMSDLNTVIEYYMQGGFPDPNQDPRLLPFVLSDTEKRQLTAFLESLSSPHVTSLIELTKKTPDGKF